MSSSARPVLCLPVLAAFPFRSYPSAASNASRPSASRFRTSLETQMQHIMSSRLGNDRTLRYTHSYLDHPLT
jgi:hypothetical protein